MNFGITKSYIKLKDNIHVELEDSKKQFQLIHSKYNGINKNLILVEIGNDCSISKEAREFGERPESNEMTKAMAVIVKSLAHRIIINFIIKFTCQQTMKMKLFDDKQKAIEWLLTFK
ncbi:MAG: STAS/SEC14 domain-containing protein [Bacteroidia bacterium]